MLDKNRRRTATRSRDIDPANPPALTARQRQILDWIRSYLETTGMPPTRAEIAAGLGFSTPSSAEDHLQALARKGAIEMLPGASRGLRLKDLPGAPMQGTLPLVGRVAAGSPILAAQHIEGRYRVDPLLFTPRADYLLRVRGESMRDAGVLDGDLLAVHSASEARNGQIVVARMGGIAGDEVTVKRFRKRGRDIVLMPENAAFEPIVVDPRTTPFAIEGIAVGLVRSKGW
ncbi:MAG TPA: transcriptional repressor LexA [Casimicrobiaceae bacterium]|jgi:repressor LexA|nr:transcriptional repressor LexA [Casimicrobiaceae bacterium]